MNKLVKSIPNTLTCCNLFSGCVAAVFAFWGDFDYAAIAVVVAAVFDFFDGFAARGLKAFSPLGGDLDSLADMVSFGLAPGVVLYSYLCATKTGTAHEVLPFVAFLIPVFSALRLAKFNIDTRQTTSFIGLPTPANALFWVFAIATLSHHGLSLSPLGIVVVVAIELLTCYLMVSELPMFSLKFHDFSWANNKIRYVFLALSLILILVLRMESMPIIIVMYILMSIVEDIAMKTNSPSN